MNRRNIVNLILLLASVTLLVLLAFRIRNGATADSVAVIRTAGMTCSSCSEKIIRELSREKGVAVTEVDVPGGLVVVGYDGKVVNPDKLVQRVGSAGYRGNLQGIMTTERFRQITGREIGRSAGDAGGCGGCGQNGGCGTRKSSDQGEKNEG